MPAMPNNLLTAQTNPAAGEQIIPLLQGSAFRLEQIISHGIPSPEGFWYEQPDSEWVMLVRGEAVLQFETGPDQRLQAGTTMTIPARRKHRVASVSQDAIWLTLHYTPAAAQ